MRNLKRALSLALASVMLLGMMVVGSSAAFSDADEIVNKKAVEITAGLGLFAGSDGKFNPAGTVTRAQMAAVIAKMFYGSDLNADTYKGNGQFTDTASFEGGWAEGYINLGVEKGWFKGYGDGTFRPGQEVTTAEAMTMIINLLGIDAGEGTWPLTVMAAAEEHKLFDDQATLKPAPATNVAMTRDQLAVVVLNGLYYSAEGLKGYTVNGKKFETMADALAYVATDDTVVEVEFEDVDDLDGDGNTTETLKKQITQQGDLTVYMISEARGKTLKEEVFNLVSITGFITENQATGEKYTMVGGAEMNIETGLDMLGHFVTVYFDSEDRWKGEKNPGTVYCIVDNAEYITVAEDIDNDKKEYKAAFDGTKYDVAYYATFDANGFADYETDIPGYPSYTKGHTADAGTYVIDARPKSETAGKIIAYLAPMNASVDEVLTITTTAGKEAIRLSNAGKLSNTEDDDVVVEYDGIAEDDFVIVRNYRDTMTYLLKPEVVSGKITKTGKVDGDPAVYVDGKAYLNGPALPGVDLLDEAAADLEADRTITYDVYLFDGKVVGANVASSAADLSEVIFVTANYDTTSDSAYGEQLEYYYAQGVNAEGKEVSVLIGIEGVEEEDTLSSTYLPVVDKLDVGEFYTFEKSKDREQAKKDVMTGTKTKPYDGLDGTPGNDDDYNAKVDDFYSEKITVPAGGMELTQKDKKVGDARITSETKFIVVEKNASIDELEIATYTGKITKTLNEDDILMYAAAEDENENKVAKMVVILTAKSALNVTDFIYISAYEAANASLVDGGAEVKVYFSKENKWDTIVVNDDVIDAGFYAGWEIEDDVYNLDPVEVEDKDQFFLDEEVLAIFDGELGTTEIADLDASNAVISDVRDPEDIEDADIAELTSLKEIQAAIKKGYRVTVEVKVDTEKDPNVITHIFVTAVDYEFEYCDGTTEWVPDDGAVISEHKNVTNGICDHCGEEI